MGNRRMVFGDVIVFDVVATLGGTATTAFGGVAVSTLVAVGTGVGHWAARTRLNRMVRWRTDVSILHWP